MQGLDRRSWKEPPRRSPGSSRRLRSEPWGTKGWRLSKPRDRIPISDKREQESRNKSKISDTSRRAEESAFRPETTGSMWWRSSRESAGELAGPSRSSIQEPRGSGRWSSWQ